MLAGQPGALVLPLHSCARGSSPLPALPPHSHAPPGNSKKRKGPTQPSPALHLHAHRVVLRDLGPMIHIILLHQQRHQVRVLEHQIHLVPAQSRGGGDGAGDQAGSGMHGLSLNHATRPPTQEPCRCVGTLLADGVHSFPLQGPLPLQAPPHQRTRWTGRQPHSPAGADQLQRATSPSPWRLPCPST